MIDTIRVKFPLQPSITQLEGWDRHTTIASTGEIRDKFTLNVLLAEDRVSIRCTFLPIDYSGKPLLTTELSLPKAVFGNNFTMIHDLPAAVDRANSLLRTIDCLPVLDISEGTLIRFDPCYNHQVGDLVPDYINALAQLDFPHRSTKHHKDQGAEFRSKHTTTKFYDKQREAGDKNAYGILRQETTYLSSKRIAHILGKRDPHLADLSPDVILTLLVKDLASLHAYDRIIADHDTALATLCAKYGPDEGIYYFGLLQAKVEAGKLQVKRRTKLHPKTLGRRLSKIRDAGLALTLTDRTEPLPPLRIDL